MPEAQAGQLSRRRGGFITLPPAARLPRRPERAVAGEKRLTKLLLNVNVQGSLGPVQVLMSPENTVGELIKAALEAHMRERRRPVRADPGCFQLHYSQFSLESINWEEKLMNLGSRNFFLCRNRPCSGDNTVKNPFPLTGLMDFLL